MNSVTIIGHLGNDPESQELEDGGTLTRLSVATNENWTTNAGDRRERTAWHRVVAFGRLAEVCHQHLTQGDQVAVRGKLRTSTWEDDDGNSRRSVEIRAQEVEFLNTSTEDVEDVGF